MLNISPVTTNMYELKQIHSNANINVDNWDHAAVVEYVFPPNGDG